MRITAEEKAIVRARVLREAEQLFRRGPIDELTTRDVAKAARIAHGTLFNYFATREELALAVLDLALARAHARARAKLRAGASLAEDLYVVLHEELRELRPDRALVGWALAKALAPLRSVEGAAGKLRAGELGVLVELLRARGIDAAAQPNTLHLYWTLYLGVLGFWVGDTSPGAEDTRALLDDTTELVAGLWHAREPNKK
jgi:AcrR family transcriptional regulator